jgi:hypothetical protein
VAAATPRLGYRLLLRSANYQQIHKATAGVTFEPPLTQAELGAEQVNVIEFSPKQLALLEQRLIEGSDQLGRKVSFRLDGPMQGGDNLFAWDSGAGPGSKGAGPELFLSLGPPPQETPPPFYVIITSTPTPENVLTAAANSLRMTVEATQVGTATPLPGNWVTPVVVTSMPTPANSATVEYWQAVMLTTGTPTPTPANMQTATPTAVFILLNGEIPTPALTPTATATPHFIPSELVGKIAFLSDRAYHTNAHTGKAEGEPWLPLGEPVESAMCHTS